MDERPPFAAVDVTRPNIDLEFPSGLKGWRPISMDTNRWVESRTFKDNQGEVGLEYNLIFKNKVLSLDYEDNVQDVLCPSNGLYIRSNSLELEPNTVVSLSGVWRCKGDETKPSLLRKVVSLERIRNDVLFVATEDVHPLEIIQHGTYDFVYNPSVARIATKSKRFGADWEFSETDGINYDPSSDGALVTWRLQDDGATFETATYLKVVTGVRVSLDIGYAGLNSFRATVFGSAELHHTTSLVVDKGRTDLFDKMVIENQYLLGFPVPLGPVALELAVLGGLRLKAELDNAKTLQYGIAFQASGSIEGGIQYTSAYGWQPVNNIQYGYQLETITANYVDVSIKLYAIPVYSLIVDPLLVKPINFSVIPFIGATLDTHHSCIGKDVPHYSLYYGVNYHIDFSDVEIPSFLFFGPWHFDTAKEYDGTIIPQTNLDYTWASGCIGDLNSKDRSNNMKNFQNITTASASYQLLIEYGTFVEDCDFTSSCDVYVTINYCGDTRQTATIEDNNQPNWYTSYSYNTIVSGCSWLLTVYDEDLTLDEELWSFTIYPDAGRWIYTDPSTSDSIVYTLTYLPPEYSSIQPGLWTSMTNLSASQIIIKLDTNGFESSDSMFLKVYCESGSAGVYTKRSLPPTTGVYDNYVYINGNGQTFEINLNGPYTEVFYVLVSKFSTSDVRFSLFLAAVQLIDNTEIDLDFTLQTLSGSYTYFQLSNTLQWDSAVMISEASPATATLHVSGVETQLTAPSNGGSSTLWVASSMLDNSPLIQVVFDASTQQTGSVSVKVLPCYEINLYKSITILYPDNKDTDLLFSITLLPTTSTVTVEFDTVISTILVYNIPPAGSLNAAPSLILNNNNTFVLQNNQYAHLVIEVIHPVSLNNHNVTFYPKGYPSSGATTFLPSSNITQFFAAPLVPLDYSFANAYPIAVVDLENFESVTLASSLQEPFPMGLDPNEPAIYYDPSTTNSSSFMSLFRFSASTTASNAVQFGLGTFSSGASKTSTLLPAFLKLITGWSISLTEDVSFSQTFPNGSVSLLEINMPTSFFGVQVTCQGALLHGFYNLQSAKTSGNNYVSLVSNGLSKVYVDITTFDQITCNLHINELKQPAVAVTGSYMNISSIQSGQSSITFILTNAQYNFNNDLFSDPATAITFVTSFTSNLGSNSKAWFKKVRVALMNNATTWIQKISETEIKLNIPSVPEYDPPTSEVLVFSMPATAIVPNAVLQDDVAITIVGPEPATSDGGGLGSTSSPTNGSFEEVSSATQLFVAKLWIALAVILNWVL